jgi:predicted PurR-regulated permease PerM
MVFAFIAGIAFAVSIPSGNWIQRAPESFAILKQKLAFLAEPITYLQSILHNIENMGADAGKTGAPAALTQGDALPGIILFGTASTVSQLFTTIVILYFMLASGDRLLRALIEVLPTFRDKRRAVEIVGEIQTNIASYLMTVTLMNAAVGILTGAAMWLCGLADPVLWGAVAFLLNFVPIIGPLMGLAVFFAAGLVGLAWPLPALAPLLLYCLIHMTESQLLTPLLVARRFELNPVLVILSLFFWHAIWGIPGTLLAVPLLAIFKILADRIDPLKPLGHLIGA